MAPLGITGRNDLIFSWQFRGSVQAEIQACCRHWRAAEVRSLSPWLEPSWAADSVAFSLGWQLAGVGMCPSSCFSLSTYPTPNLNLIIWICMDKETESQDCVNANNSLWRGLWKKRMSFGAGLPHPLGLLEVWVGCVLALRGCLVVQMVLNKAEVCVLVIYYGIKTAPKWCRNIIYFAHKFVIWPDLALKASLCSSVSRGGWPGGWRVCIQGDSLAWLASRCWLLTGSSARAEGWSLSSSPRGLGFLLRGDWVTRACVPWAGGYCIPYPFYSSMPFPLTPCSKPISLASGFSFLGWDSLLLYSKGSILWILLHIAFSLTSTFWKSFHISS